MIAMITVTADQLAAARLGPRFGRLDLCSQLAVLAVEKLGINLDSFPRDRIAICLAAEPGSLATDFDYWKGRDSVGGPSPTLFAYTLPSSALGEIAIRHRITGPNLCFFGGEDLVAAEAKNLLERGEADACLCVSCRVITEELAELLGMKPTAEARASFMSKG